MMFVVKDSDVFVSHGPHTAAELSTVQLLFSLNHPVPKCSAQNRTKSLGKPMAVQLKDLVIPAWS